MIPGALLLVGALIRPVASSDGAVPPETAVAAEVPALKIGTPVVVVLLDGHRLEGTFAGFEAQAVRLTGPRGVEPIPLVLVGAVEVSGHAWTPAAFLEGARRAADALPPLGVPHPVVPLVASFAWAGTGHLVLHDTRSFLGYAALDAILVGAGLVFVLERHWGALAPVVAVDLVLRSWAGQESAREAARRRALRRVYTTLPAVPPNAPPAETPPVPTGSLEDAVAPGALQDPPEDSLRLDR
ncbi:MAG: hypothetical protein JXB39_10110 [Deltaproteobacteria bacterium]|nr:hypothetical protein [Deltaproteobacteria bacterium]